MRTGETLSAESEKTRAALLDAAEQIMLEEGYAGVTSRRVAGRAGLNAALVYYYFGTMDGLYVALFQRGADQSFQRQAQALSSQQPLWALWDLMRDESHSALTMEFIALAHHRKAIRAEIASYSQRLRDMQLDAVSKIAKEHGARPDVPSPVALILLMSSVSRFFLMEEAFGRVTGHEETIEFIEERLRGIEGERRTG